jgi:hypothetical protein
MNRNLFLKLQETQRKLEAVETMHKMIATDATELNYDAEDKKLAEEGMIRF